MRMVSKYHCPKCHRINEVDYGDLSDLTQPDVYLLELQELLLISLGDR